MTYLCDELVPWVDQRFATIAERDGRAVQGKSSGGYGALVLPMMRPELWGGLGDVSGDSRPVLDSHIRTVLRDGNIVFP